VVSRDERDWPAVRAAVEARLEELGLSTAEAAHQMHMAKGTLQAFLEGRTRPQEATLGTINDGLSLPYDHLTAIADKRTPYPPLPVPASTPSRETPVAALLSLTDLGPGAQLVSDYKAYVSMVARELTEGMTKQQRSDVGNFLYDLAPAVKYQRF
jgi:transcriptional regulator with XRE-family HTH domain